MSNYTTVSQTLNALKNEGYDLDFNLKQDCVECKGLELHPDEFIIDRFYRFEGASNPDDNAIVYAISSASGLKGTLVDAYGVYADSLTQEMIEKLRIKR
ncbi:phosphoribosylpyrophosphate synthetase [Paracnuella aquatica]|uniref:phosphoribosylpyrophosphate synthetase n=1 Tax=Paracnuella aquatica TaxID=2268757 RepID=UPI000DF015CA|nr:phosphoribosylpyrophosphate synthetase [Paracnuella aquatica]RPD44178.1 phosphoribosylpyrophosphate synthetase [Paracnuella aquatica]